MTKYDKDEFLQKGELKYKNENPFQLQHPYRALCVGSSGSGKTYFLLKHILLDPKMPFDKVIWCAPAFSLEQSKLQEVKKKLKNKLVLIDGLDEEKLQEMIDNKPKDEQWLIVLDDLITKTDSNFIKDLFISGRHKSVSTVEILQQVYAGKTGRTHRLNSDYFLLFNFPDRSEARRLLQQLEPKNFHKLCDCYEQSIERDNGHGCLIVDNKHHTRDNGSNMLRYRDNSLDHSWLLE